MMTMNVIGRITKDFELKKVEKSGCIYANFSLAVNEGFGNNQKTFYFDCTVFGADAERLVKAKAGKGSLINVIGKFGVSDYTRPNGEPGYNLKLTILAWSYIPGANGGKKDADTNSNGSNGGAYGNNSTGYGNVPVPNEIPDAYPPVDDYNGMTNLDDDNGQAF